MRPDFIKVLTERPRSKGQFDGYHDVRKRGPIDEDEVGGIESMTRPYGWERKEFSDLLGPLYRFLQSSVGRSWNDVHSEICQNLKGRSTVQQHLLDHVKTSVETDLRVGSDGKLYDERNLPYEVTTYSRHMFYVDPRDGRLYVRPQRSWKHDRKRRPSNDNQRSFDDGRTFRLENGLWFEVFIEEKTISWYDTRRERRFYQTLENVTKRSVNKRDLRDYGLKNAA